MVPHNGLLMQCFMKCATSVHAVQVQASIELCCQASDPVFNMRASQRAQCGKPDCARHPRQALIAS